MWLHWNRWSCALRLTQELLLSATSRRISGETSEEPVMSPKSFASVELLRQLI